MESESSGLAPDDQAWLHNFVRERFARLGGAAAIGIESLTDDIMGELKQLAASGDARAERVSGAAKQAAVAELVRAFFGDEDRPR